MNFYTIVFLSLAVAAVTADTSDDILYSAYKDKFNKRHRAREAATRKTLFFQKHSHIEAHNTGNKTWKMAHNAFSDMTSDEKAAHLGLKPKLIQKMLIASSPSIANSRALPSSLDYRSHTCMPPVKDQGQCASCWAFSAITPIEFNKCRNSVNKTKVLLSEQMLVDCMYTSSDNGGCDGGWFDDAWDYMKAVGGAMYPYPYQSGVTSAPGPCKFSKSAIGAQVSSYAAISFPYTNVEAIKAYLNSDGPLPSAMKVLDSLYNYASGIYSDPGCVLSDVYDINHAITIVGYGSTTTTDYWIVRNSWSSYWGQRGYFLIQRGVNMCNIEVWAAYVRIV